MVDKLMMSDNVEYGCRRLDMMEVLRNNLCMIREQVSLSGVIVKIVSDKIKRMEEVIETIWKCKDAYLTMNEIGKEKEPKEPNELKKIDLHKLRKMSDEEREFDEIYKRYKETGKYHEIFERESMRFLEILAKSIERNENLLGISRDVYLDLVFKVLENEDISGGRVMNFLIHSKITFELLLNEERIPEDRIVQVLRRRDLLLPIVLIFYKYSREKLSGDLTEGAKSRVFKAFGIDLKNERTLLGR